MKLQKNNKIKRMAWFDKSVYIHVQGVNNLSGYKQQSF